MGRTPCASIHSTIAEEQGAQQACSNTSCASSGISISLFCFFTPAKVNIIFHTAKLSSFFEEKEIKKGLAMHAVYNKIITFAPN